MKSEAIAAVRMFNRLFPGPVESSEFQDRRLTKQAAHAQAVAEVQAYWLDGDWVMMDSEEDYIFWDNVSQSARWGIFLVRYRRSQPD